MDVPTHTSGALSPKALQNDSCAWITYNPGKEGNQREDPHLAKALFPNKNLPDMAARGGFYASCFQRGWVSVLK